MNPKFSIVLPTKDRPEYAEVALKSIKLQTYDDFEVVFCDNYLNKSAHEVFEKNSDHRFKYVKPKNFLGMSDNWEYAIDLCIGEYIIFLIDKTVLLPFALEKLSKTILDNSGVEIISFYHENYYLESPNDLNKGKFRAVHQSVESQKYNPNAILKESLEFAQNRGLEGVKYFYGKLCYGAFSNSLIQKIKKVNGRLFYPIAPDYTSRTSALLLSNYCIDIGESLLISFSGTGLSNGANCAKFPHVNKAFISTYPNFEKIIENLPIKHLYSSQHNCVAYDYEYIIKKTKKEYDFKINRSNLFIRAFNDLLLLDWNGDNIEKIIQWKILIKSCWNEYPSTFINFIPIYFSFIITNIKKSIMPTQIFKFFKSFIKKILPDKVVVYHECNSIFEAIDIMTKSK